MSRYRKILAGLLLGSLLLGCGIMTALAGCAQATTWQQLKSKMSPHEANSLQDMAYYCGSEDGFDYFFVQSGLRLTDISGTTYRVSSAESPVNKRFPYTKVRSHWVSFDLRAEMPTEELRAAVMKQFDQQSAPVSKDSIALPATPK